MSEIQLILEGLELFRDLPESSLKELSSLCTLKVFENGEKILAQMMQSG